MLTIIASLLIAAVVFLLGAAAVIFAGLYDVAATTPHWSATSWLLETTRTRSVKAQAAGIVVPPGITDPAKVIIGVEHYAAHCAVCHGAPGVPKGDIARGLNPLPPDLAKSAQLYSPAELFWIVKHGIKMTAMPSWSDHSDEELWATVGFLEKLAGMSEQDYAKLVMASMAHRDHHHNDGGHGDTTQPNHTR